MRLNKSWPKVISIGCLLFMAAPPLMAAQPRHFNLVEATISSVHQAMRHHKLTCTQLINDYLLRIKKYNLNLGRGAPINAFVAINPNVFSQANKLDQYYVRTGHFLGTMHCIPVIVKDNIDTIDTPSTSGSLALLGSQPTKNAFLVQKLRDEGAIIIGKGAMDEFASGSSGISSKSGRVGNAYDPLQNPGGSSAGPAAAVSANFAMVGIGTDNSGSIRIPAAFNGIYGLRPSTGLISQAGIFPRGNMDGVAGPMARNVQDLAITLTAIASSPDVRDPKTKSIPRVKSYVSYLQPNALKGKQIGIITSVGGKNTFDPHNKSASRIFRQTFLNLQKMGATLIKIQLPQFDSIRTYNMAGEVQDVNDYLSSFPSTRQNYRDICLSGRTETFGGSKACLHHLKETVVRNGKIFKKVLTTFKKNRVYCQHMMQSHHLAAMIMPINAEGGPSYNIQRINTWRAAISSNSGLPAITIIGGYTKSDIPMPVGLELIGKMYGEAELIALAYSYESHRPNRKLPQMPMPSKASSMLQMSIPEINNLFTLIGYTTFNKYLKKNKTQMITPKKFTQLINPIIQKYTKEE